MTTRARVESDFVYDGVRLSIATKTEGGRLVRTWSEHPADLYVPTGTTPDDHEAARRPYVQFTDDEARAIYAALGEYFGTQVSDNRLLRADYDAERRRVDKFIDAMIKE